MNAVSLMEQKAVASRHAPAALEYLVSKYEVSSVLHLGCEAGLALEWLADQGIYTLCVEGAPGRQSGLRSLDNSLKHDFTAGPFFPSVHLDLAWCAGLLEQLPEEYWPNCLAAMQACSLVCLVCSPNDGPATTVKYWNNRMSALGFNYDAGESVNLQAFWREGQGTILLFRKKV